MGLVLELEPSCAGDEAVAEEDEEEEEEEDDEEDEFEAENADESDRESEMDELVDSDGDNAGPFIGTPLWLGLGGRGVLSDNRDATSSD